MARPKHLFAYGDPPPDLTALATAYAGGFVRNHPFVDGNKRIAYVAARTFLIRNGWNLVAGAEEKFFAVYGLAAREMSEDEFTIWVRSHLAPRAQ